MRTREIKAILRGLLPRPELEVRRARFQQPRELRDGPTLPSWVLFWAYDTSVRCYVNNDRTENEDRQLDALRDLIPGLIVVQADPRRIERLLITEKWPKATRDDEAVVTP